MLNMNGIISLYLDTKIDDDGIISLAKYLSCITKLQKLNIGGIKFDI